MRESRGGAWRGKTIARVRALIEQADHHPHHGAAAAGGFREDEL